MNSTTWIISPNVLVWGLLIVATGALCCIAWFIRRLSRINTQQTDQVLKSSQSAWRNVERAVTWLSFVLVLIGIGYLTTIGKQEAKVADFSALATVMGVLVTLLVGWQIYSTIRSTEQIEKIENEFSRLEKSVEQIMDDKIKEYDYEVGAMMFLTMGKGPAQLHQFMEFLNLQLNKNFATDLLNQSLNHLGLALQSINHNPKSPNYNSLYEALLSVVGLIEKCEKSLTKIETGNIDIVIKGITDDSTPHEGVDKKSILDRLKAIKKNVNIIKSINLSPTPSGEIE